MEDFMNLKLYFVIIPTVMAYIKGKAQRGMYLFSNRGFITHKQ